MEADPGIDGVRLVLPSGEVWMFEARGAVKMAVEPSLYLERGRLEPRATKQIILSGSMSEYSARVTWKLAKTADTPDAIRDFAWGNLEDEQSE